VKPISFAPRAVLDLEAIADYIATDNPARAVTFVREIRERCRLLGNFPESARRFAELGKEARILPYGNYVILYRNLPREVSIERIVHGARDILALLSDAD
jgi:plasmid stabilization system protein ParE